MSKFMKPEDMLAELAEMAVQMKARDTAKVNGTLDPYELYIYYPYDDYLNSPLWRKIRRRVFKRDGRLCCRCGGKAKIVHHRSYEPEVMRGNGDDQLVSVCDPCHELIHRNLDGTPREKSEWDMVLFGQSQ